MRCSVARRLPVPERSSQRLTQRILFALRSGNLDESAIRWATNQRECRQVLDASPMDNDTLTVLTEQWFFERACIGVAAGYALRVIEHVVWASKKSHNQSLGDVVRFTLMNIPQSSLVGLAFGYLLLAITAHFLQSRTVIEVCSYAIPALMAFLAIDLRVLLRRISRIG